MSTHRQAPTLEAEKLRLYVALETHDLAHRFERYLESGSGHAFAIAR